MHAAAFARARGHLDKARKKLAQMDQAIDLNDMADAWSDFLTEIHRAFTKLKKACDKGQAKGWYDKIEEVRSDDDLLSYIRHARNAEDHGINTISGYEAFRYWRHPNPANHTTYMQHIHNMVVITYSHPPDGDPGVPYGALPQGAKLFHQVARILLRFVEDRGETYAPPRTHLGQQIPDTEWHARAVGTLAVAYLSNVLTEAESKFLPKS